jgi:glycosyltransferase involved in cell wall biosynthesis
MSLLKGIGEGGAVTHLIGFEGPRADQFQKVADHLFLLKNVGSNLTRKARLLRAILQVSKQYCIDVIQAQDYLSLYPAYVAASFLRKPLFFTKAGGEVPSYFIPEGVKVIVFSRELEEGMKHAGYSNNISLIQARIDCETFQPASLSNIFVSEYHLPLDGVKVAMAMRFDTGKKRWLEGLFENLERLKNGNIVFVLAGDGPLLSWISNKASKINEELNRTVVCLIGKVTEPEEMRSLYSYSDIVIGHGRGIMEAMACGKVAVNIGENGFSTVVEPEIIEKMSYYNFSGRHLRQHPELGKPLLGEILRLSTAPGLMESLGNFSHRYIRQFYDVKLGSRALLDLYNADLLDCGLTDFFRFVAQRTKNIFLNNIKSKD